MHYIQNKGWFEASGKKVGSKRKINLELARIAGFENDSAAFTRLRIESGISVACLLEKWNAGRELAVKSTAAA